MKEYQLLTTGNKVSLLDVETHETVTLEVAVSELIFSLYEKTIEYSETDSAEKRKELETLIHLQSKALNSMANGLSALKR